MKQDSKPVMSNTVDKHTPGKWYMDDHGYIKSDNGEPELWQQKSICRMFGDSKEREDDGNLVTSAPTLKKENEELHLLAAELRSLKQTIAESGLKKLFPQKENISFHDKVVFAIHDMEERNRVLVEALQECREWYVNNADKIAPETPICFSKALSLIKSNQ